MENIYYHCRKFSIYFLVFVAVHVFALSAYAGVNSYLVEYSYDAAGRLTSVGFEGGMTNFYEYDVNGNRSRVYTVNRFDLDGDEIPNDNDNCPEVHNPDQADSDNDNMGNACDTDNDNDGVLDADDAFPLDPAESVDTDDDGIGNNADTDDDNDGVLDADDAFPLDANESADFDGDGVGDNADLDDDNDNVADDVDCMPLDGLIANEAQELCDGIDNDCDGETDEGWDSDHDGITICSDTLPEVNILSPLSGDVVDLDSLAILTGEAFTSQGDPLGSEYLNWSSSVDGELGNGNNLELNDISIGTHIITLVVRDDNGLQSESSVTVVVKQTDAFLLDEFSDGLKSRTLEFNDETLSQTLNISLPRDAVVVNGQLSIKGLPTLENDILWLEEVSQTYFHDINVDPDGNLIVTGYFFNEVVFDDITLTGGGIFIVKYDSNMNVLWAKRSSANKANHSAIDSEGNIFIVGSFYGTATFDNIQLVAEGGNPGLEDMFVAKYDPDGNALWAHRAGNASKTVANGLVIDENNDIYVTGSTAGYTPFDDQGHAVDPGHSLFLAKYNTLGEVLWARGYFYNSGNHFGFAIQRDNQGDLLITGSFNGSITFGGETFTTINHGDTFLLKLNPAGDIVWVKQVGEGEGYSWAYSLDVDRYDNIIINGGFSDDITFGDVVLTSAGETDSYFAKFDTNGNFLWAKRSGGLYEDTLASMDEVGGAAFDSSGNVYVSGSFRTEADFDDIVVLGDSPYCQKNYFAKYDADGNVIWATNLGNSNRCTTIADINFDNLNNMYLVGNNIALKFGPSYPQNPELDVTNNQNINWSYQGMFTDYEITEDFLVDINDYLNNYQGEDELVLVPLVFSSEISGNLEISDLDIQFTLPDRDGDGVLNEDDAFPDDPTESVDTDLDGIGDNADTDDDNDGVVDLDDAFPFDANESVDTDGDGIGDNADLDDDNDNVPDVSDNCAGTIGVEVDVNGCPLPDVLCSDLQDVDGHSYENEICYLIDNGYWLVEEGETLFNPDDSVTIDPEIETILRVVGQDDEASEFEGGICADNPYLSYARDIRLIKYNNCPVGYSRTLSVAIKDGIYSLYINGEDGNDRYTQLSNSYNGPDLTGYENPYGIYYKYFMAAYMAGALPGFDVEVLDIDSDEYGSSIITKGEMAYIIFNIQGLGGDSQLVDISGHEYEEAIRYLVENGYWVLDPGQLAFNPDDSVTIEPEIQTMLRVLNLFNEAILFEGGICADNPYLSYALDIKLIKYNNCPTGYSRNMSVAIRDAIYSLYVNGEDGNARYSALVEAYNGPDLQGNQYPYGIYYKYFMAAYMAKALPGFNNGEGLDINSNEYGQKIVTRGEMAQIIYRMLGINEDREMVDISGHEYETEIRYLVENNYWVVRPGQISFLPESTVDISTEIITMLGVLGMADEASEFQGGICEDDPYLSYARDINFIKYNNCPKGYSRSMGQTIRDGIYALYVSGESGNARYSGLTNAYNGPDLTGITNPYGIYYKYFMAAYMAGALPGFNNGEGYDINSNEYGSQLATNADAAYIIYHILGLGEDSSLLDISGHAYETEIRYLVENDHWPMAEGAITFNPDDQVSIESEIETMLSVIGQHDIASQFVGGICADNSYLSYATDIKLIKYSNCPAGYSRSMGSALRDAIYSLYLDGESGPARYSALTDSYNGPDLTGITNPYGIHYKYFKAAYMAGALPGFNNGEGFDINSADYASQVVTRSEMAYIIYHIQGLTE